MSRNAESRFAVNPTNIDIQRSKFKMHSSLKTSFNVGDLIPIFVQEVLPGDTFQIETNKVVRMQTLITPVMDNIYLDTYYFFVPNRLVWEHWKEFNGENSSGAWTQTIEYTVPQLLAPHGMSKDTPTGWEVGTLADYFGIPTGVEISVNALPFRAYALIVNEWFRDQNLVDPLLFPLTDSDVQGTNGSDASDIAKGGKPFVAAKFHDYFTSCLPAPQKGPAVSLFSGLAPVRTSDNINPSIDDFREDDNYVYPMMFKGAVYGINQATSQPIAPPVAWSNFEDELGDYPSPWVSPGQNAFLVGDTDKSLIKWNNWLTGESNVPGKSNGQSRMTQYAIPVNLVADIGLAGVSTINELRTAFQIQRLLERDARGGTRYVSILKNHFGVTSPDSRLQRPEYLGGNRIPININQVVQTSETQSTPQGTTAAYSQTADSHDDFTHSFTEHGFIIGLCVARYDHTYQQGLERFWSRKTRYDFYWPALANLGEMAVLRKEIMATGESTDDEVFGYQEAWADYRYRPSHVTGEMRSTYAQSLDVWHLGDIYPSVPTLSAGWIQEDKSNVDRVLMVQSSEANQLFGDFYIKCFATRPMPMYSIPGLIDHH